VASLEHQLSALRLGQHLAALYEHTDELIEIAAPFFRDGLAHDHCCLYVADDQASADISAKLEAVGLPKQEGHGPHPLRVVTKYDTYVRYGRFDPVLMFWLLDSLIEQIQSEGFKGLRLMTEMTWALGLGCAGLVPYEARLNEHYETWPLLGICQYNLHHFGANILQDIVRTHPDLIVRGELYKNVFYEPAPLVLGEATADARLQWMMETVRNYSRLRSNSGPPRD
jgi:chemotaxis family two-component system sensor kinase Cph1